MESIGEKSHWLLSEGRTGKGETGGRETAWKAVGGWEQGGGSARGEEWAALGDEGEIEPDLVIY